MPYTNWGDIAIQDGFRTASPENQQALRMAWMRDVAPQVYGQAWSDPKVRQAVAAQVAISVPAKLADEDQIITPDILKYDNYSRLEANPLFAKHSYADQQTLRWLWYTKTSRSDPKFQAMSPMDQQRVYESMMARSPSFAGMARFDEPTLQAEAQGAVHATTLAQKIVANFAQPIAASFNAISKILPGPAADTLQDALKEVEYLNMHDTRAPFWTQTLPNLAGNAALFAQGTPGGGAMKILAGEATGTLTRGVLGVAAEHTPGILELGARAVGLKAVPGEALRVAANAISGAGVGITQNIGEGRPLQEGLLANIALGVGLGTLGEVGGNILRARRLAKKAGLKTSMVIDLFDGKFDPNQTLSPEMLTIVQQNPDLLAMAQKNVALHKSGLPMSIAKAPETVQAVGKDMGLEVFFEKDAVVVHDMSGKHPDWKRSGISDPLAQVDAVWEHFDTLDPSIVDKVAPKKSPSEFVESSPTTSLYKGAWIPAEQRTVVLDTMKRTGNAAGLDFTLDPHGSTSKIDDIIGTVIRFKSDSKANMNRMMYSLRGKGIDITLGQARKLWADVRKTSPVGTHVYVDAATGSVIQNWQMYLRKYGLNVASKTQAGQLLPDKEVVHNAKNSPPVAFVESDMPTQFADSAIITGSAADIRNYLNRTLMKDVAEKAADTRQETSAALGGRALTIERSFPLNMYTIETKFPTGDGMVTVHTTFNNPRELYRFLERGGRFVQGTGSFKAGKGVFIDKRVQSAYDDFLKDAPKGTKNRSTEYLPYLFTAKQASDNGWTLASYKGKYYLTDTLSPSSADLTKYSFDTLNDVQNFLLKHNVDAIPDMIDVPKETLNEAEARTEIPINPFEALKEADFNANRRFGIVNYIRSLVSPSQYMATAFDHIEDIRNAGINPTRVYDTLRGSFQMYNSYLQQRELYINNVLTKGVSKQMSEDLWRYIQAFDTAQHASAILKDKVGSFQWETKRELEAVFKQQHGAEYVSTLQSKAALINNYLNAVFSQIGLDKTMFVHNYFPRMAAEIKTKGISSTDVLRWDNITSLSEGEKKAFFEFARGNDPVEFAYETNIKKVLTQYTNLAGRKMFVRPIMKQIANDVKDAVAQYEVKYGVRSENLQAYIDYTRHIFQNINGLVTENERAIRAATNETISGLRKMLRRGDKKGTTAPSVDALSDDSIKQYKDAVKRKMAAQAKAKAGEKLTQEEQDLIAGADPSMAHLLAVISDDPGIVEGAGYKPETVGGKIAKHDALSGLLTTITASVISFKPELVTRNFAQSLTVGAPLIGLRWWQKGLEATFIPGNMARVRRMGLASPETTPIGTGELSTKGAMGKAVELSMYPHKWSDMFGRANIYLGMEARTRSALDLLEKRQISPKQFERMSGMNLFGPEAHNEALHLLDAGKGKDAFVHYLASKASDQVNYIYQGFDKPQMFKGVMGRMFGQFGTWPINYVNFALNQVRQLRYHPEQAAAFLARSAAVMYLIRSSFNKAGIDATPYIPWETMFFTGGPYYTLMNDLLNAGKGDEASARRAITGLRALIPFAGAATTLDRSLEAALEGSWYEAFVNLAIGHPSLTVFPQRKGVIDKGFDMLKGAASGAVKGVKTFGEETLGKL